MHPFVAFIDPQSHSVDVKELKTYQQLYLYIIPIITNLGFINIVVVVVRLYWFKRHLKRLGRKSSRPVLWRLLTTGGNSSSVAQP
jgi:hypothetical protein